MKPEILPDNVKKLPYYKIFTQEERLAARCCQLFRCEICNIKMFYCDVLNLLEVMPLTLVCPDCRKTYRKSFEEKREKYFAKNQNTAN